MRSDPDTPPEARDPRNCAARAWLAPGLVAAGLLLLARTAVIRALAEHERGVLPEVARWAAATRLSTTALHALVLGLTAMALACFVRPGARARVAALLVALLFLSALSGWPIDPGRDVPGPSGALSLANSWILAALAAAGGLLAVVVARALRRDPALSARVGSPTAIAVASIAGFAAPLTLVWLDARRAPLMPVREVVTDLVQEPGRGIGVREDEEHRASAGRICPLVDARTDSAEKSALVMPPPCEIELEVLSAEDGAALHASAGIDLSARRRLPEERSTLRVRFEIEVDGRSVLDETVVMRAEPLLWREGRQGEAAWRHAGGPEGIPLRAGQRVRLRTSLPDYGPDHVPEPGRGLAVGFGGMTLERRAGRPRTLATPDTPNIVLIVMDTLRADRMSCYGYSKPTTPHVDRVAARGLLFEEAYATSSWTWPATASILTGLLPDEHGVTSNASSTLGLAYQTLAEALQARGYTTAAISCNPLIAPERDFDQGFESFASDAHMRMTDEVIDEVLASVARLADVRFFLYLHLADPHTPHLPLASELARLGGRMPDDFPGDERDGLDIYSGRLLAGEHLDADGAPHPERVVPPAHAQWIHDAYDASVGTGDHYVGLVLAALERLGLDDRTVIAFTSDHGEELFDHGFLAHGHTLHRELTRVPLILAGPHLPRGLRVTQEVSNRHLAPTLARLGGGELRDLRDALDLLAPELAAQPVYYQTEKGYWNGHRGLALHGLRQEGYVVHHAPAGGDFGAEARPEGQYRLFRFEDDPDEHVDLARGAAHGERGRALVRAVEQSLAAQKAARRSTALGASAGTMGVLRGVGYVGDDDDDERLESPGAGSAAEKSGGRQ